MAGRDAFIADIDAFRCAGDEFRDFILTLMAKGTTEVVALVRQENQLPEGFIPSRLEIKDHPEFDHFPLNVLFGNTKVVDGKPTMWTALYEPEFSLYKMSDDGNAARMFYHNRFNRDWYLVIVWKNIQGKESYEGLKYSTVSNEPVMVATGGDWNKFFTQLTMFGPVNGEACEIDPIP